MYPNPNLNLNLNLHASPSPSQRPAQRGFTLIELLLAIGLMALMTVLSWRGLDGMSRAQTQLHQHADEVLTLQAGLSQWGADLDALTPQPNSPSLDWDGRALRLLRANSTQPAEGLRVVAWTRRAAGGPSPWLRWQSPPLKTRGELQDAWQQAALWAQSPSLEARQREVAIVPLTDWQIFYYRSNAWSNPLSSEGARVAGPVPLDPNAKVASAVPDGIRLVLTLPPGQAISGVLTRDWLSPKLSGAK